MGFGYLFKKIFGPSAATPVDERALSGASEDAVASSLGSWRTASADGFARASGPPVLDGRSAIRVR